MDWADSEVGVPVTSSSIVRPHTPGPWHLLPQNSLCIEAPSGNVALCNLARESIADARLIAAAPELLAALSELVATKELHDQLEVLKPLNPAREEEYRTRRVAAWNAARAAVAKAEGRS